MAGEVKVTVNPGELDSVIDLRYRILRKPWDQPFETSRDELEEQSINAYISENGSVVACGRLQKNANAEGQIRYMAVDEAYRGKGYGKAVLHFLEKEARLMGLKTIMLQARENAVEFYVKENYNMVGPSFLLWGKIQHFQMEKRI
jgi:N-acetylglutamate synthase-like GNAT family acetyltransferase